MPMKIARMGVEDDQRLVDDAERQQQLVEQALGLQDADPGVDADQEDGPERQDDQHQQRRPQRRRRARHAVGDRDSRPAAPGTSRSPAIDDAGDIGVEVERVLGQPDVVVEVELARSCRNRPARPSPRSKHRRIGRHGDRRLRQRDLEDDDEGNEEEDQQPEIGNDDDQAADAALASGPRAVEAAADGIGMPAPIASARRRHPAGRRSRRGRSRSADPRSTRAAVERAGLDDLPVVEPDVVDGHVAEIGDVVDLAFDGVDGARRPASSTRP